MPTSATRKKKSKSKAPSWDEKVARLRKRKPREITVTLADDDAEQDVIAARLALATARRAARARLEEAGDAPSDAEEAPEVLQAIADLEQAQEDAQALALEWTFAALPPDVFDTMQLDHPPTDEQKALGMEYDNKSYVPALIADCSTQPITVEQVSALLWGDPDAEDPEDRKPTFNQGEVAMLFGAALTANQKSQVVLGKASRMTRS